MKRKEATTRAIARARKQATQHNHAKTAIGRPGQKKRYNSRKR